MARVEHRFDAAPFLPRARDLASLREAAKGCRGCHLYAPATQTVFGEGSEKARLALIGDVRGRPIESDLADLVTATTHPSAILRAPDDDARQSMREQFTSDLATVAEFLAA